MIIIKIVLASASPRRRDLLNQIGVDFTVISPDIDETNRMKLDAVQLVQFLAYEKALYVAKTLSEMKETCLVIGADTVVVKDYVLGKPKDENEAYEMLKHLQGDWHHVMTGVAVINTKDLSGKKNVEITHVKMKEMSDGTIKSYIQSKEPFDKAGAYGIQGLGSILVERINGCYFNVVGLPLSKLNILLNDFGVYLL